MNLGELVNTVPLEIRCELDAAMAQLPWDAYADIGNVYFAVLMQHTGWARPAMFNFSHELAEQQAAILMEERAEAPKPANPTPDLSYA